MYLPVFVSGFVGKWLHNLVSAARLRRAALCDPRRAIGGMVGKTATEQFLGEIVWNTLLGV